MHLCIVVYSVSSLDPLGIKSHKGGGIWPSSPTIPITMRSSRLLLTGLLPLVHAALLPRASIDHDKVVGFPETVPNGTTGDVYLAYQPLLYVVNGCVPFPAVDAEGNTK